MKIISRLCFFPVLITLFTCHLSFSADAPDYRQRLGELITYEEAEDEFLQESDSYIRYMPSRGAKSVSGSVSIVQAVTEYSYDLKIAGKLPVQLGVAAKYTGIDNTTNVKLPSSLTFATFAAEITLPFFNLENNYFRVNLEPSLFGSKWNFRSSNFRFLQQYFLISQWRENLVFILGVAVFPDFEDEVWPIAGFIWQPNDKLSFNIIPKNPSINYSLNEKLDIFLEWDIALGEYEVDRSDVKNVVLQYNETVAGAGFQYKINKNIQFLFSAGGIFDRYLKYRDGLGKVSIKNGAYVNCQFQVRI
ncbi:MAG: hypothetical protein JXL82_03395 [Candidatus Omnitrophica bacterium]|nr:hypothetical protein [Candidatus Omnitrophota bacterium]